MVPEAVDNFRLIKSSFAINLLVVFSFHERASHELLSSYQPFPIRTQPAGSPRPTTNCQNAHYWNMTYNDCLIASLIFSRLLD